MTKNKIIVSSPSRLCLFGEHLDYLGLEVISMGVNLRFYAEVTPRDDELVVIDIDNHKEEDYPFISRAVPDVHEEIPLNEPLIYDSSRDYLKSCVNLLKREGFLEGRGLSVRMHSDVPVGMGMSSSTTMIMTLIKALLESSGSAMAKDPDFMSALGYNAEVVEFEEAGGMMDHYTCAYGNMMHIDFSDPEIIPTPLENRLPGQFIIFDSVENKDTIGILRSVRSEIDFSLEKLSHYGVSNIKELYYDMDNLKHLEILTPRARKMLLAAADNYAIVREALWMFKSSRFSEERFGELLSRHQANLRDGLGVSTPVIDRIIETAMKNGALGGKLNGSGGGGGCFVYCRRQDSAGILNAVAETGYPGMVIKPDGGTRIEVN